MVKLGDKVKDKINGFKGIAVARAEWLQGCIRIGVKNEKLKDGKPFATEWFDEEDLETIACVKIKKKKPKGGLARDLADKRGI